MDIEALRQVTKESKARIETEHQYQLSEAEIMKAEENQRKAQLVIDQIEQKAFEAAQRGLNRVEIFRMGYGGYTDDGYPMGTEVNWNVYDRIKKYCIEQGLNTEEDVENDRNPNWNFHTTHKLYINW